MKNRRSSHMNKLEQVHATNITLEEETANNLVVDRTNVSAVFLDSLDVYNTSQNSETINDAVPRGSPSGLIEWHQPDTDNLAIIPPSGSGFPKSAQMFVDAIKKNRACQKFLRSKLLQIEARLEENKTLKQRVKTLKDFQVSCKKRTGRALSQKKDSRVQLISAVKPRADSKVNGKKVSPLNYGPNENSHVAIYRTFQELLLQKSVDLISDDGSSGRSNGFDSIIASIRDLDITPENIRSFLPKVNWERLASMYITRRSGAECEAR
ncbi:myb domain protein 4r1 [Actinidia rufa]|uniref:Myb domain protein 4r1 n=1 Tax=Actinidia rufa TaxID=165716 RepID=A0A7J0EN41_9ERIC|nr:myb domain protein 4r1 [Actinidia rufa]